MARLRTRGRALRGLLHVSSGQDTLRVAWKPDQEPPKEALVSRSKAEGSS